MKSRTEKRVLCLLFLILIQISALASGPIAQAQGNFTFINSYWGSSTNPQKAYPGSSDARLIVSIRNDLGNDLLSVSATIYLPAGVSSYDGKSYANATGYTQHNDTVSYYVKAGETFQLDFWLNVQNTTLPGEYSCNTLVSYNSLGGEGGESLTISFTISDFPDYSFQTVDVYWTTSGGAAVSASSGSRNLNLNIVQRNLGEDAVDGIDARIDLGNPFTPSKVLSGVNNVGKGDTFTLVFTGISIPVTTGSGSYSTSLQLNCTFNGYGNAVDVSTYTIPVTVSVSGMPSPGLKLVSVSWQDFDKTYPGARKVWLTVEVQNLGDYVVSDILSVLRLPNGFTDPYGNPVVNATSGASINYGAFATLTIGPIYISSSVNPGIYYSEATIYSVGLRDSTQLMLSQSLTLPLIVSGASLYIDLGSVAWTFNGQPAVAIPGATNLALSITLINRGEDTLSGLAASIQLPQGFKLIGASYGTGPIAPAASLTVTFYLNISQNVTTGQYASPLTLTFNANPSSGNNVVSTSIQTPFTVEDPNRFDSPVRLVNAYWGRPGNPTPIYPGSRFSPLTLEFVNNGIYGVQGAYIRVTFGNGFEGVVNQTQLAATLASGSFSSTTLYANVKPSTTPGNYSFSVTQSYFIEVYGAFLYREHSLTVQLQVFKPPVQAPYVKVVSSGWENGSPAYPGCKDAVFTLIIANEAPYSIAGVSTRLLLPEGFSEGGLNGLMTYVPGPIASWQTATLSFRANIGSEVAPRNYTGRLAVEYTLLSGGDNLRVSEENEVTVNVNSLGGFEPVYSNWLSYSPGPGNAGATLLIIVRNNEVPQMRGVYATVRLPQGFTATLTGMETVNVTPVTFTSTTQVQDIISMLTGQGLPTGQAAPVTQTQVGKGDILALSIQVNIGNETTVGYYNLDLEFSFIDQWGSIQRAGLKAFYWLPGSTLSVEVTEGKSRLLIGSRTSIIELFIKNVGTASIRDVYVAIVGAPQGVSVSSSFKYLPDIGPQQESNLTWLASVNLQTPYTGSLPILVSISFTDALGYRHPLNQTAIIFVEGIVELRLLDTTTSPETPYSGGSITVSTTLLNLGTYKARHVEAFLDGAILKPGLGNYTYVGDVDIGAQVPVSLTAALRDVTGNKTVYLIVSYRDVFNAPVTLTFPIDIIVAEKPAQPPPQPTWLDLTDVYKIALIIMAFFLAGSGYIIYRMYQKTKHRVQG